MTAEEGSFSAAARALGQTQPTLGRQVAALEATLGITVFERVGRSLVLTQSGLELLEHVRAMGDAANRISLTASGHVQSIDGLVRITASDVFSAYMLPAVVRKLRQAAPLIEIDIVASNEIQDLQRREADIAIRHVRPEQPDLIARLVREEAAHFYAAPSYLNARGFPQTVADLSNHDHVSYGDVDRMMAHLAGAGVSLSRANFLVRSESGVAAWEMVKAGLGIGIMSQDVGAATPEVTRILPDWPPVVFPIWLVTHRELHTSRRIRLVFDLLADHFNPS